MDDKKMIAICQLGGEFKTNRDGSLSYSGGDAHAIDIDDHMTFDDFKKEVAEMFSCGINTMSIKYFLPGNKKTLITISNDKDLKRMITFHGDSLTTDVYIMMETPDVSNMPASRSSRTTLSEAVPPIDPPLDVMDNIVSDTNQPNFSLGAPLDVNDGANNVVAHIDDVQIVLPEISPSLSLIHSNEEKHVKAAQQW